MEHFWRGEFGGKGILWYLFQALLKRRQEWFSSVRCTKICSISGVIQLNPDYNSSQSPSLMALKMEFFLYHHGKVFPMRWKSSGRYAEGKGRPLSLILIGKLRWTYPWKSYGTFNWDYFHVIMVGTVVEHHPRRRKERIKGEARGPLSPTSFKNCGGGLLKQSAWIVFVNHQSKVKIDLSIIL